MLGFVILAPLCLQNLSTVQLISWNLNEFPQFSIRRQVENNWLPWQHLRTKEHFKTCKIILNGLKKTCKISLQYLESFRSYWDKFPIQEDSPPGYIVLRKTQISYFKTNIRPEKLDCNFCFFFTKFLPVRLALECHTILWPMNEQESFFEWSMSWSFILINTIFIFFSWSIIWFIKFEFLSA